MIGLKVESKTKPGQAVQLFGRWEGSVVQMDSAVRVPVTHCSTPARDTLPAVAANTDRRDRGGFKSGDKPNN